MNKLQTVTSYAMTDTNLNKFKAHDMIYWFKKYKLLYIMLVPGLVYFAIFRFLPVFGMVIAFKDYNIMKGIFGSDWVAFKHFRTFFEYPESWKLIRNTILLNTYNIIYAVPAAILFAVLLNELRDGLLKKCVQTVSYLPHFVSTVVVVGIFYNLLSPSVGIVNLILKEAFSVEPVAFLMQPRWFRTVYNVINIWQETGWNAIIYLAALISIDLTLYESAYIDGAGRFKQFLYISLPGLKPTILVMLILRIGVIMEVGYESVMLLYSPAVYETADVIPTYIYRRGIVDSDFSYSAAVGMIQSVIGLTLMLLANKLSKRFAGAGLW